MGLNLNIIKYCAVGSCIFFLIGCKQSIVKEEQSFTKGLIAEQISEIHYGVQGLVNNETDLTVQKVYDSPEYNKKSFPSILNKSVDIRWYGKAETLLNALSEEFEDEFVFKLLGKPVSHPVDVYINSEDEPLFNVLKNIGFQLGASALLDVVIDPFNKSQVNIELTYEADK